MIDLTTTIYFIILLSTLLFFIKKYNGDAFHVIPLFLLLSIAEVPYLYYISHNTEELHQQVLYYLNDFEVSFLKHVFFKLVFIFFCLIAMLLFKPKVYSRAAVMLSNGNGSITLLVFFSAVSIGSFIAFLEQVGGLFYLISNMDNKTNVVKGTALYRNLFFISSLLAVGAYISSLNPYRVSIRNVLFLIFVVIVYFLMLASFGERKNPLLLIVFTFIMWNYAIRKLDVFSLKNLVIILFFILFSSIAPVLRNQGAFELYLLHPSDLVKDSLPYLGELFKRFSDIDISLFIYSYFDESGKFWYGATFSDFFSGFIPSSLYENKPPLDEGVYIYNMAQGLVVEIGSPFKDMIPVGWPLSRVTSGYIHFGIVGIVVYAIFTGVILKYFYNLMVYSSYSPIWVAFYTYLMLIGFGISNAFVFNAITILCLLVILSFITNLFRGLNVSR